MLLSVLLTLTPRKPTTLEGFYGRQAHGWFLGQVEKYDPALSAHLHFSTIRLLYKLGEIAPEFCDETVRQASRLLHQWITDNTGISPESHGSPHSLLNLIRQEYKGQVNNVDGQVFSELFQTIKEDDPELATILQRYAQQRPYTISDLLVRKGGPRGENGRIHIVPGNECQIRITSIYQPLSELLLSQIVSHLPQTLYLRQSAKHIAAFKELRLSEENEWDGESTFQDIAHQASGFRGKSVTMEFNSPTAFRSGKVDLTLPTPDQVWRSLWWRWNAFAPPELNIDALWPDFAGACLIVSDYCLRSRKVIFKNGSKGAATGATGQATYRLLDERHCGEFASFRPGADQVLRTLAGFALYAGVGHHTTIGLGQTRWLA